MITFTRQPGTIALSGNQVLYEIKGTDPDGNPFFYRGARAELRSVGANGLSAGHVVTVNWEEPEGLSLSVGFSTAASAAIAALSVNQLPPYSTGSYLTYWETVAAKMAAHPQLRPFFTFFAVDNGDGTYSVWCTARLYETGWQVGFGPDGAPAFTAQAFPDITTNDPGGYRIRTDVFLEESYAANTYARIATISSPVANDSKVLFNIAGILDQGSRNLLPELMVPAWDAAVPAVSPTMFRYYIRSYEQTDNADGDYTNFLISSTQRILCGGISQTLAAQIDYLATRNAESNWLTWRPDGQIVSPDQPYFLSWYAYPPGGGLLGDVVLQVQEYTEDGTSTTKYMFVDSPLDSDSYNVYVWAVGPEALEIGATTVRYRVRVMRLDVVADGDPQTYSAASPWRLFHIDRSYHEEVRYLAYVNSFCCPEVVRCVGDHDEDMKLEREESQAIIPVGYAATFPELRNHRTDWQSYFTYRTGYLSRNEATALQELQISPRVYEISPGGYIPLALEGKSFSISSTRQNLHAMEVQARPALLDRYFSRLYDPLAEPALPNPEAWQSPDGAYWLSAVGLPWESPA